MTPAGGGLACANCRQPMQVLALQGHYGRPVEIDLCAACHLLWFDSIESARLTGPSLLRLLRQGVQAQREPHRPFRDARCPRCAGPLKSVHNRSRFGATVQHECLRGHGTVQTFAQFLAEKGLIRPPLPADRTALALRGAESLACLNCGAPMRPDDLTCAHCDSPLAIFDVARLAAALDPEGATEPMSVHRMPGERRMPACHACGAPTTLDGRIDCGHCGATLVVGRLEHALAAVGTIEAALTAHQSRPAPHVRSRRLRRLQTDLDRRRDFNREMQASAQADRTRGGWSGPEHDPPSGWWRFAGAAALLAVLWKFFGR